LIDVIFHSGLNEWREDVKRVLKTAGGQGRDVVFLILDSQLNNAVFLQDIDSLLNAGLVPNIFSVEEKQELIEVRC
jgi:dynein heavy chain